MVPIVQPSLALAALLLNRKAALLAHLAILVEDAMDAPLAHGLAVVNMLRCEGSITPEDDLNQ